MTQSDDHTSLAGLREQYHVCGASPMFFQYMVAYLGHLIQKHICSLCQIVFGYIVNSCSAVQQRPAQRGARQSNTGRPAVCSVYEQIRTTHWAAASMSNERKAVIFDP